MAMPQVHLVAYCVDLGHGTAIGAGQDPDREASGRRGTAAGRRHHAAQAAADDDRAAIGELSPDRLGELALALGRLARADYRDVRPVRHDRGR